MLDLLVDILRFLGALFFFAVLLVAHHLLTRSIRKREEGSIQLPGEEFPIETPAIFETTSDMGRIRITGDAANSSARLLFLDKVFQGYSDLDDPTSLRLAYMRVFGALVDTAAPEAARVSTLSIGGGACTIARYVAATRPGSFNEVIEADPVVTELAAEYFDITPGRTATFRIGDAATAVPVLDDDSYDLVFGDVYGDTETTPRKLRTVQFHSEVKRLLRGDGVYAVNVIDTGDFDIVRSDIATLRSIFNHVVLVWPLEAGGSREGGNFVILAGRRLSAQQIERELQARSLASEVLDGPALIDFVNGARRQEGA